MVERGSLVAGAAVSYTPALRALVPGVAFGH